MNCLEAPLDLGLSHVRATPHGRNVIVISHDGLGSAAVCDSLALKPER